MSPSQKKTVRWTARIFFLAGFFALAVLVDNPAFLHGILPACSPFLALLSLAAGGASLVLLPSLVFFGICLFRPRFFCRWICPAGTCFEAVGIGIDRCQRCRSAGGGNVSESRVTDHPASRDFPSYRCVPVMKFSRLRFPRLNIWLFSLGTGAALIGYPLFIMLDPLAIFSSAFSWLRPELTLWEKAAACVFPAMVLTAVFAPRIWCGKLCPLGAMQDIATAGFAGRGVGVNTQRSTGRVGSIGRRVFMGLGIGALYRLLLHPAELHAETAPVRPPLSGTEARFTRLCARCGACARACPEQIIIQTGMECGFAGVLAPVLDFSRGGCPPDCTRCGEVCPTGAIPLFTQQDKSDVPLGSAVLKKKRCVLTHNRECGICMNACPHQAIDIGWDAYEMTSTLKIDAQLCTGCGICEYVCPENPPAIVVAKQVPPVAGA
ncbi:MAG: 4Fe-4S binding protein [Kiritimatiellia bacterium]